MSGVRKKGTRTLEAKTVFIDLKTDVKLSKTSKTSK